MPDSGGVGLGFRKQKNGDHCTVIFRRDGTYGLYHYIAEGGIWGPKHTGTRKDLFQVEDGITNYFSIAAKGSTFTIYENGSQLAVVEDNTILSKGGVGLAIELPEVEQIDACGI